MKIALLTANIGGIDEINAPVKQKQDYDYFYYTENTLPFPLPSLNNRMKGKYLKIQSHKFLDHDIFVWIDGSVNIKDGTFLTWVVNQLHDNDVIICEHYDRHNVYDEIDCIMENIKKGHPYLIERYAGQPFQSEYDFYIKEGMPEDFPLFNCWFFARRNNDAANNLFNHWWDMVLRYTSFDQTQFSYCAWKSNARINIVDAGEYLERKPHK